MICKLPSWMTYGLFNRKSSISSINTLLIAHLLNTDVKKLKEKAFLSEDDCTLIRIKKGLANKETLMRYQLLRYSHLPELLAIKINASKFSQNETIHKFSARNAVVLDCFFHNLITRYGIFKLEQFVHLILQGDKFTPIYNRFLIDIVESDGHMRHLRLRDHSHLVDVKPINEKDAKDIIDFADNHVYKIAPKTFEVIIASKF